MCRSCASHLSRVKKELLDRLHKHERTKATQNPTTKNTTKPKESATCSVAPRAKKA